MGIPNGTSTAFGVKNPIFIANMAIKEAIAEFKTNGIIKITFITKGNPKTTGSLMPSTAGRNPNLAIALWSSLLEAINIAIISENT